MRAPSDAVRERLCHQWVSAAASHSIVCRCGAEHKIWEGAIRCLYCGEWFCISCAESHYGQTVREWSASKTEEAKIASCK